MDVREQFRLCALMASIDGRLTAKERVALRRSALRLGLGGEEAEAILDQVGTRPVPDLRQLEDEEERAALLRCLADVIVADGILDPEEMDLLHRLAGRVGLEETAINRIVSRAVDRARDA